MRLTPIPLLLFVTLLFSQASLAEQQSTAEEPEVRNRVSQLDKPLYNPFIERYLLDEVKALRTELQSQRAEFLTELNRKQLTLANHSVTYATDTVTYFFYLVAGVSSLLVLVGWTSIRDIKEKALSLTDQEVTKLVSRYEKRLKSVEEQMNDKERLISENKSELERTNEVHSLWLRASQEVSEEQKIAIYDQILQLRPDDVEALTYKADAALELSEPKWAINLCRQALQIDPENGHAFYQLACAASALGELDEACQHLQKAIDISPDYLGYADSDPQLRPLAESGRLAGLTLNQPDQ
ncbi:tetratricopeptide repeat protein [Ferrimonas sediminicola]|uniref:Tetratricopeptide repeat protein n=1 Tax=Ferrimonas sediminicola TaxID=2569538 RepID=A0A4U1BE29_9GAMM|nr:tetratricopeptide repeat protein [Ferrimonas sediminicola]TKB48877.1 tetratricopeptide repeat protein [Ferrimonas sediminicola]